MIDPQLSLSFSMYSNKGVYALLLGSGISRSAGIPTGWEVTLDLIRKLALLQGKNCEPDPSKWYEETFTETADYSKLLNFVAKTSSERSQLLRRYFEPSDEEKEQKLKTPTPAHKAIAELVAKGFVKVIITTNFDRLMEKALEEIGIAPVVISTPDAVNGAPPVVHTQCTVIKVHGDYLDTRIKNTPEELAAYDELLNTLLERVFDEFGLIICGWSGEWDTALREAILRCKNRRYTTYWTVKDSLGEKAREVANYRKAEIIQIQSADSFFTTLNENLIAIEEYELPHPLSAKIAIATFKRYLDEEKYKIRLHDLVMQETERLFESISPTIYPNQQPRPDKEEFLRRLTQYEAKTEILQAMMIVGGYWGDQNLAQLFVKCLERLSDHQKQRDGFKVWLDLQSYPILLLLYSTGLSALAADNYEFLYTLLLLPQNKYENYGKEPLLLSVYPSKVLDYDLCRTLPNLERRWTPASDHLVEFLCSPLKEYIPEQKEFEDKFDRLEYIISLSVCDYYLKMSKDRWAPIGRFGWRGRHYGNYQITNQVQNEIDIEKENWKPLKAGFFGGSIDRAMAAQKEVIEQINRTGWY